MHVQLLPTLTRRTDTRAQSEKHKAERVRRDNIGNPDRYLAKRPSHAPDFQRAVAEKHILDARTSAADPNEKN